MRCIPCGGGGLQPELAHLNDCYPPSKALLASGPDYRPLGQDLSKLTYFATNKPSKLASIGDALEKRVTKEATRSTGGYVKSRASLLISLAILKGLLTECKRDIGLFSRSALRIIDKSLDVKVYQGGVTDKLDLEVVARATGCFVAFTTFTDGAGVGVDDSLTRTYSSILRKFDALAIWSDLTTTSEKVDMEVQSRTRLIALAALNGASTSDAMFSSNAQLPKQVELILPPLLINIFSESAHNISDLKLETAKIEMDASPSPFFSEFSTRRPIHDRRAPSLHAHVTGEKGPSNSDVLSASVRTLQALVAQCKVGQITHIIDNIISFLDRGNYWKDVERCCWLAERLTAWISLQYRFVVPTRLVEVLVDLQDKPILPKHTSLIAMITSILTSHTSLVGLGVTDLLNNLTALIIRRVKISMTDAMLPPLVHCIASLGTHIYYADQINDIVEEISIRIAELQTSDPSRDEIVRVLIHCIMGVMQVAQKADEHAASRQAFGANAGEQEKETNVDKGKGPQIGTPLDTPRHHTSRRNPISPEVWQETLPLLCEGDYGVRSAYSRALLLFLETELPRIGIPQPLSKPKPTTMEVSQYRFCNALHAAIYTLVMSSCLGAGSTESADASPLIAPTNEKDIKAGGESESEPAQTAVPPSSGAGGSGRGEKGVSFNITEPSPAATPPLAGNGATTPTKQRRGSRRVSLPLNRLHSYNALPSFSNVATPYDFAASVSILDKIHSHIPGPALITGVPMLLALDKDAGSELIRRPGDGRQGAWVLERKRAVRELVAIVWRRIGERWNVANVEDFAHSTLMALPEPYLVPVLHSWPSDLPLLPGSEEPVSFPPHHLEGESSMTARPLIDPDVVLSGIASSQRVQIAFGRDASGLMKRFLIKWSVESAVRDSVERFSSANVRPSDDPHYDVASVLMSMNNGSYTSFGGRQQQARSIDVEDLREALGGRTDITPSASGSIISSVDDHSRIHAHAQQGSGGSVLGGLPPLTRPQSNGSSKTAKRRQPDVKDVLKDIFKDKKRAANAKAVNGSGRLADNQANTDGDNGTASHSHAAVAPTADVNGHSTSATTSTNTKTNADDGGMVNVNVNGIQLGKPVPA